MIKTNLKCLATLLFLLLTACASQNLTGVTDASTKKNSDSTDAATPTKMRSAKHVSSWAITGAVAAKNKRKAWTASLNWKQQGQNHYQLHLYGPLGGGSVLVEKKGRTITYQDGPKRITTSNIDQLFYKETGIRIPLHNLYYWVRGVKAPGAVQSSTQDAAGHLTTLTQAGYTIQYEGYQTVQGVDLPTKLRLSGSEGNLKLIIKQWKIH